MKQITILIAGQSAFGRGVLKEIFEEKYFVIEAESAQEALDILNRKQKIDLILLTLGLKAGKTELLEILRREKRFADVPAVVCLSEERKEEKQEALSLGADYLIQKPLNPKLLMLEVKNIIARCAVRENTVQQGDRESVERNELVWDTFPGAVLEVAVSDKIQVLYFNQGLCSMSGFCREELQKMLTADALGFLADPSVQNLRQLLASEKETSAVCEHVLLKHAQGKVVWGNASVRLKEIRGKARIYYVWIQDVTKELAEKQFLEKRVQKLQQRAEQDIVTGLYNKKAFFVETAKLLGEAKGNSYVMIVWGLDHYSVVRELFGERTAEQILCRLANEFRHRVKGMGICCRMEEDRFLVCVERDYLEQYFGEFERMLFGNDGWNNLDYPITSHMGLYRIEDCTQTVDAIVERAATALWVIQENYVKRWNYYNENLNEMLLMGKKMLEDMEGALKAREFQVFYQPVVDVTSRKVVGMEALVRWEHPQRGCISPGAFISLFEQNGFVTRLDMFVIEEICKFQQRRRQEGLERLPVSVNLSRIDFYNPGLCSKIMSLLQKYGLSPDDLELEISNNAYKDNLKNLLTAIEGFQKCGFQVILDDFGGEYAYLNMLKDISVDILKIDMKFIKDSKTSVRAGNILYNVIQMAKALQMKIAVEGVETTQQYELLCRMGCDWIQGYYFSRPLPAQEVEENILRIQEASGNLPVRESRGSVLVVDDASINREIIRVSVDPRYQVLEASDGMEALDILADRFPEINLVILDLQMPRMDGFTLLEKMREHPYLKSIPVLVVTAYKDRQNMTRALELGALDVVMKPYDMDVLRKRIENLFRLSEQRYMETEVQSLKAGMLMREEMQKMFGNSEASLCRMRIAAVEPYVLGEVVFANEQFNYIHPDIYLKEQDVRGWDCLLDNVLPSDQDKIRTLWRETLAEKAQAFQFVYRFPWEDGQINNILLSCTLEYDRGEVVANIIELRLAERDYDRLGTLMEIFSKQIDMAADINIAFWDMEEDTLDFTVKRRGRKYERSILSEASRRLLDNGWFEGDSGEQIKEMMQRLKSGEDDVEAQLCLRLPVLGGKRENRWKQVSCRRNAEICKLSQNRDVVLIVAEDITERKRYEERRWRELQYKEIVANHAFLFSEIDLTDNRFLTEDMRLEFLMFGVDTKDSYDAFVEKWAEQYIFEEERGACRTFLSREKIFQWFAEGERVITFDFRSDMNHNCEYEWYTSSMYLVKSEENGHIYGSWRIQNIQDEKWQYNRIKQLAEHDELTGLYNRFTLEKHVANTFAQKSEAGFLAAFIMLDVDNFKAVNDNFGHDFGDSVLRAMGGLLRHIFRKDDIIARFGGDEFAVFIPCTNSREGIIKRLDEVCRRSRMMFDNQGTHIYISCSVGVVFAPDEGCDFTALYRKADEALYEAKKAGKNQYRIYKGKEVRTEYGTSGTET